MVTISYWDYVKSKGNESLSYFSGANDFVDEVDRQEKARLLLDKDASDFTKNLFRKTDDFLLAFEQKLPEYGILKANEFHSNYLLQNNIYYFLSEKMKKEGSLSNKDIQLFNILKFDGNLVADRFDRDSDEFEKVFKKNDKIFVDYLNELEQSVDLDIKENKVNELTHEKMLLLAKNHAVKIKENGKKYIENISIDKLGELTSNMSHQLLKEGIDEHGNRFNGYIPVVNQFKKDVLERIADYADNMTQCKVHLKGSLNQTFNAVSDLNDKYLLENDDVKKMAFALILILTKNDENLFGLNCLKKEDLMNSQELGRYLVLNNTVFNPAEVMNNDKFYYDNHEQKIFVDNNHLFRNLLVHETGSSYIKNFKNYLSHFEYTMDEDDFTIMLGEINKNVAKTWFQSCDKYDFPEMDDYSGDNYKFKMVKEQINKYLDYLLNNKPDLASDLVEKMYNQSPLAMYHVFNTSKLLDVAKTQNENAIHWIVDYVISSENPDELKYELTQQKINQSKSLDYELACLKSNLGLDAEKHPVANLICQQEKNEELKKLNKKERKFNH